MEFPKEAPLYATEIRREGGEDILYVNYQGALFVPSVSEYSEVMEQTITQLIDNPGVSRIVFVQQKQYNYDFEETRMLIEVAHLYTYLSKHERILSPEKLTLSEPELFPQRYNQLLQILLLLKRDPVYAYFELKRLILEAQVLVDKTPQNSKVEHSTYLTLLLRISALFDQTEMIKKARNFFDTYRRGERTIYYALFKPDLIPSFTFTRLISDTPDNFELVSQYTISGSESDTSTVSIFKQPDEAKLLYQLTPPESMLSEEHTTLLNLARQVLIEHQPKAEELTDTDRTRQVFFNISKDLLTDLSQTKQIKVTYSDLQLLATILVRHTIGFGLIEILLQDDKLQDIVLNAPIPLTPVFVRHQDFDECATNILPSQEDVNSWAAKFRLISGRPLDESNPILDTQMSVGNFRARVAIIQPPLSPDGLSYALRRHRESPWTLPLFLKQKMLNPMAAGVLSFLVDGSRTILVAGTRSSGKTSLLGSLLLEIVPRYRIIVIEDSLELPVESLRALKYDILRMKVRSALLKTTTEVSADDGIRTSLRLGDSCLIVGEVRSVEAKALYEAMRVGALANVVAGTIHGGSPYAVFDRVVNDLEVPATSFKATDIIAVANPIKTPDGLHSMRRLLQISEVRKHWKKDPLEEGGFVDLMKYNVEKDELEVSDDLLNGDSEVIKDIASNVKGWAGNWNAVYDNILLRAQLKEAIFKTATKLNNFSILEAPFIARSNDVFHKISDSVRQEVGLPISNRVFPEWQKWLNQSVKNY